MSNTQPTRAPNWISYPALGLSIVLLSGCSAVQKAQVTQTSGFLGADSAKLVAGSKEQAGMRYINPAAQWTQYKKVLIAPVTFWGAETTKVSAADQQALVNYFSQKLKEEVGKKFEVVDQPGPGVLKLAVAMTDAEAATPGLRSISMIIPQAHMISNLKYLATGTFPFVGAAQAEAKVSDAVSGETLAAVVDKQIGGGSMAAGFQWQWGDAENAITDWSKRTAEKLSKWTSGAEQP
ncbi:MAG: DUF3313 domain-containing protein [Candidatus Methylumidiphilus sp.]